MKPRAAVRLGASSLAMVILATCATGPTGEGPSVSTKPRASLRPGWAHHQSRHGTYSIGLPPGWSVNAEYCDQDAATIACELKGPNDEVASVGDDTFDHWADVQIHSLDEWSGRGMLAALDVDDEPEWWAPPARRTGGEGPQPETGWTISGRARDLRFDGHRVRVTS